MSSMGADFNSLDPAYQGELLKGIEATAESVFRTIFSPTDVQTMSGKVPFIPSKYTLLSTDDSVNSRVAINDTPDVFDASLSSADFSFDFKYAKEAKIHKSFANTLGRLRGAEDMVQYLGAIAMGMANNAFDEDGATVLKSTTLNATVTATAAWSDGANARPYADFDAAVDKAGQPDLCWLGLDYLRELAALEAFREEAGSGFAGAGGRAADSFVVEALRRRYGFEQVIVDGSVWVNSENPQQTISKARTFDGVAWVGHSDHMIVVERPDLREVDNEYDSRAGNFHQWVTEYLDIARAELNRGVAITGT